MIYMNSKTHALRRIRGDEGSSIIVDDRVPDGEFYASELPRDVMEKLLDNFAAYAAGVYKKAEEKISEIMSKPVTQETALSRLIQLGGAQAFRTDSRLAGKDLQVIVTRIPGEEQIDTQVVYTDGVIATPPVIISGKAYPWSHGDYSGPLSALPE